MGYTQYWAYDHRSPVFAEQFDGLLADAVRIVNAVEERGVKLAGWDGTGAPVVATSVIELNGPERAMGESFVIEREPQDHDVRRGWVDGFCKTNREPYDVAVTAILLRAATLMPGVFDIASDGRWELEWQFGAESWGPISHRMNPPATAWPERRIKSPASPRALLSELFDDPDLALGRPSPFQNVIDGPRTVQGSGASHAG